MSTTEVKGIQRDDTVHDETYFTAADMATAAARGFRDGQAAQAAVAAGWVMVPVIVLESAITALDWMPTSDTTRHLWDKQQPALALLQSALPPRSIY